MRRILFVLALVCGFGLPLTTQMTVRAAEQTIGPVSFTVHKASCPIDYAVDFDGGIYEACHENKVEGVSFTIDGLEVEPVVFVTDVAGVGSGQILDGISTATGVTLAEDPTALSVIGAYAYCKDQIGGLVLFDGTVPDSGVVPLGSVNTSQEIICDWYNYAPATGVDAANG